MASQDDGAIAKVLHFPHLTWLVLPFIDQDGIAFGGLVVLQRKHIGGAFCVLDDIDAIGDYLSHCGQYEEDKCDDCSDSFFHSRISSNE